MKAKLRTKEIDFVLWDEINYSFEQVKEQLKELGATDIIETTSNAGRMIHFNYPYKDKLINLSLHFAFRMIFEEGRLPELINSSDFKNLYEVI